MLKKAIIKSIAEGRATMVLLPDACAESSSCHSCGMCGKKDSDKEHLELTVPLISDLKNGDIVEVEVSGPRGSFIAFVIFLLPLILMFAGGITGSKIAGNIWMILGGVAGFLLSLAVIFILNMTILKMNGNIIRKL